jgi:quercetin dioxygenase-like cupin family protein
MNMKSSWKLPLAASTLAVLAASQLAHGKPAKHPYVMVPSNTSTFVPLDPKNPQGLQRAILAGDPQVGPVAFIMKFPKGRLPVHFHSSDYYGWVVEGKMKHWLPGKELEAHENPPGTFWFQPGGAEGVHDDECMSDTCMLYVYMNGKFDAIAVVASPSPQK